MLFERGCFCERLHLLEVHFEMVFRAGTSQLRVCTNVDLRIELHLPYQPSLATPHLFQHQHHPNPQKPNPVTPPRYTNRIPGLFSRRRSQGPRPVPQRSIGLSTHHGLTTGRYVHTYLQTRVEGSGSGRFGVGKQDSKARGELTYSESVHAPEK